MLNRFWILILVTALFSSALRAGQPAPEAVAFTHVAVVDPAVPDRAGAPHLRALIIAALSTGCRVGELLTLQ